MRLARLVRKVWTHWFTAKCMGCGRQFRSQTVKRGQIRYCSGCGRDKGVLTYEKEYREEVVQPAPHTFRNYQQQVLLRLFAEQMPAGHQMTV